MFQLCGGPRLLAAAIMMVFAAIGTFADSSLRFARGQEEMSSDFRETLSDYGQWVTHPRWGEVWVPAAPREDWRPYLLGHWVYSDEGRWYWLPDAASRRVRESNDHYQSDQGDPAERPGHCRQSWCAAFPSRCQDRTAD